MLRHLTSERSLIAFPATGGGRRVGADHAQDGRHPRRSRPTARLARYEISSPHPEVSWQALFGKVWYEGYAKPEYVWQSTGGTDDFETKFSLVPLVFGTIKGTLYALLFAIPLAILGALYTSQFMHPSLKARVKPTVEIMAALPSVVIGFIAGLWLASRVEREVVPDAADGRAAARSSAPLGILLWDRLPRSFRDRLRPGMEIAADPAALLLVGAWRGAAARALGRRLRCSAATSGCGCKSALDVVYDQRNCLVVGLAMGFAVIPIIFTIAEDAFSSVPPHLTAASLALGREPLADRRAGRPADREPRHLLGDHDRLRPRRRRDDDRADGDGQHAGARLVDLQRHADALGQHRGRDPRGALRRHAVPRRCSWPACVLFLMTFLVNTIAEVMRQRLRERYKAI